MDQNECSDNEVSNHFVIPLHYSNNDNIDHEEVISFDKNGCWSENEYPVKESAQILNNTHDSFNTLESKGDKNDNEETTTVQNPSIKTSENQSSSIPSKIVQKNSMRSAAVAKKLYDKLKNCPICMKPFEHRRRTYRHLAKVHAVRICFLCSATVSKEDSIFKKHNKQFHSVPGAEGYIRCNMCEIYNEYRYDTFHIHVEKHIKAYESTLPKAAEILRRNQIPIDLNPTGPTASSTMAGDLSQMNMCGRVKMQPRERSDNSSLENPSIRSTTTDIKSSPSGSANSIRSGYLVPHRIVKIKRYEMFTSSNEVLREKLPTDALERSSFVVTRLERNDGIQKKLPAKISKDGIPDIYTFTEEALDIPVTPVKFVRTQYSRYASMFLNPGSLENRQTNSNRRNTISATQEIGAKLETSLKQSDFQNNAQKLVKIVGVKSVKFVQDDGLCHPLQEGNRSAGCSILPCPIAAETRLKFHDEIQLVEVEVETTTRAKDVNQVIEPPPAAVVPPMQKNLNCFEDPQVELEQDFVLDDNKYSTLRKSKSMPPNVGKYYDDLNFPPRIDTVMPSEPKSHDGNNLMTSDDTTSCWTLKPLLSTSMTEIALPKSPQENSSLKIRVVSSGSAPALDKCKNADLKRLAQGYKLPRLTAPQKMAKGLSIVRSILGEWIVHPSSVSQFSKQGQKKE